MMSIAGIKSYQILEVWGRGKHVEESVCFESYGVTNEFDSRKKIPVLKEDLENIKPDLIKLIYFVSLIQFLSITGSILANINVAK